MRNSSSKFIIVILFFWLQLPALPIQHSILMVFISLVLYPKMFPSLLIRNFFISSNKQLVNNNISLPINRLSIITLYILLSWPVYLLINKIIGVQLPPNVEVVNVFNLMIGYVFEIFISIFIFYLLIKGDKYLKYARLSFWILISLIILFQVFLPDIYRNNNIFTFFGSQNYINFVRIPLIFKESSAAAPYVFAFSTLGLYQYFFQNRKKGLIEALSGVLIIFLLVRSKPAYIYVLLFLILVVIFINSYKIRSKLLIISLIGLIPFLFTSILLGYFKEGFDSLLNLFDMSSNLSFIDYTTSNMTTLATRSTMLLASFKSFVQNPFGTGWGFQSAFLFQNIQIDVTSWEVLQMLETGSKLSVKSYLPEYILGTGIIGIILLIRFFRALLTQVKIIFKQKNERLFIYSYIIALTLAALTIEGFYFFFLVLFPLTWNKKRIAKTSNS